MPWTRAVLVWMLLMLAETGNGVVREVFVAPVIGATRARQLGVFVGCAVIFVIASLTARWMNARTRRDQLRAGALWVGLTLVFEVALGRATGMGWSRIFSDYNPLRGGLMLFGLAFMFVTPLLTRRR